MPAPFALPTPVVRSIDRAVLDAIPPEGCQRGRLLRETGEAGPTVNLALRRLARRGCVEHSANYKGVRTYRATGAPLPDYP